MVGPVTAVIVGRNSYTAVTAGRRAEQRGFPAAGPADCAVRPGPASGHPDQADEGRDRLELVGADDGVPALIVRAFTAGQTAET